ncbi:major facilitator superfamily [Trypanosoma brucei equiperdum]|uniref:Major facilitator superfamily n=1 Tax=Trypanosoma brucei equiperdum TaxID=630700 RepID=A0A3L6L6R2_9TRYP|nr:major facilitator superfamily [Trypanosoma brucei equiperdum]
MTGKNHSVDRSSGFSLLIDGNEQENAELTSAAASSPSSFTVRRRMSMREHLSLFAMSFSYGLCFNTLNNIVIPKTVARITHGKESLWVGVLMGIGALCQITSPLFGACSDRLGNRTMFLTNGAMLTVVGLVLFTFVEITNSMLVLCTAHFVSSVGLSVAYSMVVALLNDYVAKEETGKGSSAMALLAIIGSGVGYTMLAVGVSTVFCLGTYALATIFCLVITLNSIPSESLRQPPQALHFSDTILNSFTIPSFRIFPDFGFACVGRGLFNCGLAVQVYIIFFLRDIVQLASPAEVTSALSVAALLGGLLGAGLSGPVSDRVGRKSLIYLAAVTCSLSLLMLLEVRSLEFLYIIGFVHGMGSASFLSVDYAIGVETLPRKDGMPIDTAKDLGIFGVSATIGTFAGQLLYGMLLHMYVSKGEGNTQRYSSIGFVAVYSVSCMAFICSGITLAFTNTK